MNLIVDPLPINSFISPYIHSGPTENGLFNYRLRKWRPVKKYDKATIFFSPVCFPKCIISADIAPNVLYHVRGQLSFSDYMWMGGLLQDIWGQKLLPGDGNCSRRRR